MKLPTIGRVEKQSREAEKRSRARKKKIQARESQKKEDTDARNVRKVAKCCVFAMLFGSAGSKSRLAKATGAESCGERTNEKLHAGCGAKRIFK